MLPDNAIPSILFRNSVASVDDVETHLNTQGLVETAVEPKPISLSRAEIYAMHTDILQNIDDVVSIARE